MRVLGIDYGEKRIGLSYGDELGVATPLPAIVTGSPAEKVQQLAQLTRSRRIEQLVVGYPYNMDGSRGFKAAEVDAFIARLESATGLPVERVDERLTSHQVEAEMRAAGRTLKKSRSLRKSGDVDSRAATLILQDFLDSRIGPPAAFPDFEEED